jgi:holo-[acyl-carrier protein] synthase
VEAVGMIGLGIDTVDVARFRRVLTRRTGMAERLFTAGERACAARQLDPAPSLAARFAAKEAVMKALGVGIGAFAWTDVEVVRPSGGRPSIVVQGKAASLASNQGVRTWHLSLTHTAALAEAVVAAMP